MASLVISNQEIIQNNRTDIKLGNLTPTIYSMLDVPTDQDPNALYAGTQWITLPNTEVDLELEGVEPGEVVNLTFKTWIRIK